MPGVYLQWNIRTRYGSCTTFPESGSKIPIPVYYFILKLMYRIIIIFLLSICSSYIAADPISYGLRFSSHTEIKEKRTSLLLSPEQNFSLKDGFTLDFDIKLREEVYNYGYVFRIISNDNRCFNLIINFSHKSRTLNLVEGEKTYISFPEDSLSGYVWNKWTHISFCLKKDSLELAFGNKKMRSSCNYPDLDEFIFNFGQSDINRFKSWDVPPMSVRDIKIFNIKDKLIASWTLKEHGPDIAYDTVEGKTAIVKNPTWIADQHVKWLEEMKSVLPEYTQVAYDEREDIIYFANTSYILKYNTNTNRTDTLFPVRGNPYVEKNNQLIYNPYYKELWSYDLDKEQISIYDFHRNEWSVPDTEIKNPDYSQHNAFISPIDSALYIYGGYGNYQFKNKILRKTRENAPWREIYYNPKIPPRSLSGAGYAGSDSIYIFGGHGHISGKQDMGTYTYYDLYILDLKTWKTDKLWDMNLDKESFVVGNTIIADKKLNKLFTLFLPYDVSSNSLTIKSFDLSTGDMASYADTIPYIFNDINSFCALYYNKEQGKIYAVTTYNHDNVSDVSVYSLMYPPVNNELINVLPPKDTQGSYIVYITLIVIVLPILLFIFFFLYRKKKTAVYAVNGEDENSGKDMMDSYIREAGHTRSAILFLGGFQVWNKNGENITKEFTPVVKQLLILIILYGQKNKKGIFNTTLKDILWFDKTEESAQNNRRVNIHKLKLLLENIEDVKLTKHNAYWSVSFGEGSYNDYIEAYKLIDFVKSKKIITRADLENLSLGLLSEPLLPSAQEDWLDEFKSEYSNQVIDTMLLLTKQKIVRNNKNLLIQIANIIFAHDKTDENALIIKCRTLWKSGKMSLAKNTYDSFCIEYKNMLDIDYPKSFKEICTIDR